MIRWVAGQKAISHIGGRPTAIQINSIDHSVLPHIISHLPESQTVPKEKQTEQHCSGDRHCVQ